MMQDVIDRETHKKSKTTKNSIIVEEGSRNKQNERKKSEQKYRPRLFPPSDLLEMPIPPSTGRLDNELF